MSFGSGERLTKSMHSNSYNRVAHSSLKSQKMVKNKNKDMVKFRF